MKIGDYVRACVGAGVILRRGRVSAVIHTSWGPDQYMVWFDGDQGHSGPCHYIEKA